MVRAEQHEDNKNQAPPTPDRHLLLIHSSNQQTLHQPGRDEIQSVSKELWRSGLSRATEKAHYTDKKTEVHGGEETLLKKWMVSGRTRTQAEM